MEGHVFCLYGLYQNHGIENFGSFQSKILESEQSIR